MRNKLFGTLLTLAALAGITQATIQPAAAQANCRYGVYETTPSAEFRWIESADGYKFKLPSNYSVIAFQDGAIGIMNPDTLQFYNCVQRSGYRSDDLYFTTVRWQYDEAEPRQEWIAFAELEYADQVVPIRYGEALGQVWAIFNVYDRYLETDIFNGIQNLSGGGSAHMQGAINNPNDREALLQAWASLQSN